MLNLASLTKKEQIELAQAIDDIFAFLGLPLSKRVIPDYESKRRQIELKINQIIKQAWEVKTEEAYKKAVEKLKLYGRNLDRLKAEMIAAGLEPVMGGEFVQAAANEGLVDHIHYAYDMAGERTATKLKLPYAFTFVDQRAKDWLAKDAVFWIGSFYNSFIKEAVVNTVIQYAIEEGQDYWVTGQRIKDVLTGAYDIPPKYLPGYYLRAESYWELVASNAVTRATVFGQIEPMLAADVEEYEILTAGDERVCPLCGRMHGKVFRIEHAVELRDKILNARTPEDIKTIHPWHRAKEIDNWEPETLAQKGMALPPFHAICRCDIIVVSFRRTLPEVLKEKESEIAGLDYERAYVFDKTGRIILKKDGSRNSVAFEKEDLALIKDKDAIFTHNHPSSGGSFSLEDIQFAVAHNQMEMRAVGRKYGHSMYRPAQGWPDLNLLTDEFYKADNEVRDEFWRRISLGQLSREEADREHHHQVWSRIAAKLNLKYTREER